jgi:hypothetical protein
MSDSESIASSAASEFSTDALRTLQPGVAGVRVKFACSSDGVFKVRLPRFRAVRAREGGRAR